MIFLALKSLFLDLLEGEEDHSRRELETGNDDLSEDLTGQTYVTPQEVKEHMIRLWESDGQLLKHLLGSCHDPGQNSKVTTPEMFFLDLVVVPPSRFRPVSIFPCLPWTQVLSGYLLVL